jgi:hypothetical protein
MAEANPYTKYKKPKGSQSAAEEDNPYTKYKKPRGLPPATGAKKSAAAKPTKKDYTWTEAFAAAPGSARQGIADALEGAGNLAYDAVTSPKDTAKRVGTAALNVAAAVGNLGAGAYTNLLDPATKGKLIGADPRFGKASATADAVGKYYAGYADPAEIRRRIAEKPISTAADVASVLTLPGVAQAGRAAGTAAAQVVPTAVTRAAQAARYAAVPTHAVNDLTNSLASRAIPAVARRVETITHPTNAMMMRAAEGRGPQAAASLRTAAPIVPGSNPTTAQALTPAGTPGLSAVAETARRARPAQALDQTTAQNQARVNHLRTIGHSDADLPGAIANRETQAAGNYAATRSAPPARIDFDLLDISRSPSMHEAWQLASAIAAERRRPFPAVAGALSGDDIHLLKQALDDLAFDGTLAARHGITRTHGRAIEDTRRQFIGWAESRNPAYRNARETHRDLSQPIDQTLVRQGLEQSLEHPSLGDATIHQRGAAFANATRDAATSNPVMFRATGQRRYDNLDDLFTPPQMGVVDDINRDFARAGLAEQQAAMGAPEFGSSLNNLVSDAIGVDMAGPYGWMARPLVGGLNRRVGERVTNAMMTPEGAAGLMENALAREATIGRYRMGYDGIRNVLTYGNPARWANRYPTLYNAMGAEEQAR